MATISFRYCLLLNNFLRIVLQFPFSSFNILLAALLGGWEGLSLKKIAKSSKGPVTMQAQQKRKSLISGMDVLSSIINPGTDAPKVIDRRVARMPVKVTIPARSLLNQFMDTLLGVLRTKILPTAARKEPIRQQKACPSSNSKRSHVPPETRRDAATKDTCMPKRLMIQLQGTAKRGCAMVNSKAFMVTAVPEMWNLSSMRTLMLEKVCTGRELTKAARMQTIKMTKRYFS